MSDKSAVEIVTLNKIYILEHYTKIAASEQVYAWSKDILTSYYQHLIGLCPHTHGVVVVRLLYTQLFIVSILGIFFKD